MPKKWANKQERDESFTQIVDRIKRQMRQLRIPYDCNVTTALIHCEWRKLNGEKPDDDKVELIDAFNANIEAVAQSAEIAKRALGDVDSAMKAAVAEPKVKATGETKAGR